MNDNLVSASREYVKRYFDTHFTDDFTYHNYGHTQRVFDSVIELAVESELEEEDMTTLALAALFHDIGYATNRTAHEEESARMAGDFFIQKGLGKVEVDRIQELIRATHKDWVGTDLLAWTLRDADLSNLGSKDFFPLSQKLFQEINNLNPEKISPEEWRDENREFLTQHKYHTKAAKELYGKRKKKNIKKLVEQSDPSTIQTQDLQTLAHSKSAQTQVKTSLRNHIDLSAIADNKASMMVTINAMILTVGLPLLIANVERIPQLMITTVLLAITSVVSMIYATLATRPISMSGITDINLIPEKKTNLFFFGNFYKMRFDDYESGINQVISDDELLNNSITRDLFFLGKSLGKKYDHLRKCYNVFMIGISLAILVGFFAFIYDIVA